MKRISKLSGILLLVIAALVLTAVFLPNRAEAATVDSGSCGSNVYWSFSDTGVLTISGYGAMKDYGGDEAPPWMKYSFHIDKVIISYGVTSIGDYAFFSCRLHSASIADSVKTIGEAAFGSCFNLDSIVIPNSVTKIKDVAFADCHNISVIHIPASVSSIGTAAFATGYDLKKIEVDSNNAYYCNDSRGALYNKNKTTLLQVPAELDHYYEVAAGTTKISKFAFYDCRLTSVAIPKSMKVVAKYAFMNCEKLQQVYYYGTKAKWANVRRGSGNKAITKATKNYNFKGTEPATVQTTHQTVYLVSRKHSKLKVVAAGTDLQYEWQKRDSSGKWSAISCSSSTYGSYFWDDDDNTKIRCKITAATGRPVYCTFKIRVLDVITYIEGYRAVPIGKTAKISIEMSGDPDYQWQYQSVEGGKWKNVKGANSNTLRVKATAENNGTKYRVVATDKVGHTYTSSACTLYVLNIKKAPVAVKAKINNDAVIEIAATGYRLKYRWQYRVPGGEWHNTSETGYKTKKLKITATADKKGYQYRCRVKDKDGNIAYSKPATLYVLEITSQPKAVKMVAGGTAVFKVSATGYGKTYQWQYRTSADSPWRNVTATGSKTATLKVPATVSGSGYQYRCVVKDSAGNTVNSKEASLYVLGIKTQPATVQAVAGTNAMLYVAATGHGLTYQWQYRTSPERKWENATDTGNNTATLKVSATAGCSGWQYRCVVKDSAGNTAYSDAATVYVLGILTQPQNVSVAAGETAVFTVSATGYGPTYQWQYRTSPEDPWQDVAQATAAQLQIITEPGMNGYEYRCVVFDFLGNTVYSEAAALTVTEPPVEEEPPTGDGKYLVYNQFGDKIPFDEYEKIYDVTLSVGSSVGLYLTDSSGNTLELTWTIVEGTSCTVEGNFITVQSSETNCLVQTEYEGVTYSCLIRTVN